MKRFHVHVGVADLETSTRFYSAMFGMPPAVKKADYAKWMLDDPRINFAISERGGAAGINHLGFQAENEIELEEIHARLRSADTAIVAEEGANCCYAKSDKYWVKDPSGIAWESFRSLDTIPYFGEDNPQADDSARSAKSCCPTPAPTKLSTPKACCNG